MEKQQKNKQINLEKMEKGKIDYARVSSQEDIQRLGIEVQKSALSDCHILFTEKESSEKDNRLDRLTRKMFTLMSLDRRI